MENIIYNEVPNIITSKDLDYLSDMFNWNYEAIKKMNIAINQVTDEIIRNTIEKGYNLFKNNLKITLSIINEGGNNEQ